MFNNDSYAKIYEMFMSLSKNDMNLAEALKVARKNNVAAGKVLARHIYTDSMCPAVGNLFSYKDFLVRNNNTGIHASTDLNGFGSINKEHGFEVGNEAIKQYFTLASQISRKYGGKQWRVGGDEGRLHFPTPARADGFVKELREKLANSPNVAGTDHKLSVSVGIGYSPEHAEQALIRAKDQLGPLVEGKRIKKSPLGKEPTVSHSLLHENPPPLWRPQTGTIPALSHEEVKETATPGLKLHNPLKDI